jgi:hypothetical protein
MISLRQYLHRSARRTNPERYAYEQLREIQALPSRTDHSGPAPRLHHRQLRRTARVAMVARREASLRLRAVGDDAREPFAPVKATLSASPAMPFELPGRIHRFAVVRGRSSAALPKPSSANPTGFKGRDMTGIVRPRQRLDLRSPRFPGVPGFTVASTPGGGGGTSEQKKLERIR